MKRLKYPVKQSLKTTIVAIGVVLLVSLQACSDDAEPRFRIRNDRSAKTNMQVKTSGGNTININDVEASVLTAYQNAAPGLIEATATIQGESVSPTISFYAFKDESYTIVVVNNSPPTLSVISP